MYGVIGGKSRKLTNLYGSISAKTRKISKVYGVVGGITKLIYTSTLPIEYPINFIERPEYENKYDLTVEDFLLNEITYKNLRVDLTSYNIPCIAPIYGGSSNMSMDNINKFGQLILPKINGSYNYLIGHKVYIYFSSGLHSYCAISGTNNTFEVYSEKYSIQKEYNITSVTGGDVIVYISGGNNYSNILELQVI